MKLRFITRFITTSLLLGCALPAAAQYSQYTAPGSLPFKEPPTKEKLERASTESRWHLGKVRLDPWYALRNVGWLDNVFNSSGDPVSDWTATLGVGLHAYSHAGPKIIIAAHALPEYVWWKDLTDRRTWNGRYGLGAFGYFNHLTFELTGTTARETQYLSSELEQPVNLRRDRGAGKIELDIGGHFSVFAGGETLSLQYDDQNVGGPLGEQVIMLDRDENRLNGGLRYRFSKDFNLAIGLDDISVDFTNPRRDRSNSGTAPMAELTLNRRKIHFSLLALYPDLKPKKGSEFTAFHHWLGRFQARWAPKSKGELQLYGSKNLVYSVSVNSPYYTDQRLGLAAGMPFGHRIGVRIFGETGTNDYAESFFGQSEPDQDLFSYGLNFGFRFHRKMTFRLTARRTNYSSDDNARDRSVTQIGFNLVLGEGTSEWW